MQIWVKTNGGRKSIEAQTFGAFAVHLNIYPSDDEDEQRYVVTHIRTGCALPGEYDDFNRAGACAQFLNSALLLGDFDETEGEAWDAFRARVPRIIIGIQAI